MLFLAKVVEFYGRYGIIKNAEYFLRGAFV